MMPRESRNRKKKKNQQRSWIKRIGVGCWWTLNCLVAIVHIMSAFGGHVRPEFSGFVSASSMAFPYIILLTLLMLIIDLIVIRKSAFVPLAAIIVTIRPILLISPVNIPSSLSDDERQRSFTLMTYNVYNFLNKQGEYPDDTNPTVTYILRENPDVVALQECEYLSYLKKSHFYSEQADSLKSRYPYRIIGDTDGQTLLSKFPIQSIPLVDFGEKRTRIQAYKVTIGGNAVNIINVHLYSIQLTKDDKGTYLNLTRGDAKGNIRKARANLMVKLGAALRRHGEECRALRKAIDSHFSENDNVIICGDFNDTPGSHAYWTLRGDDFSDAYSDCAFGPTITYNEKRFYFRIDHVLYRGNLKAHDISRGNIRYSDHYPFITTFVFNEK